MSDASRSGLFLRFSIAVLASALAAACAGGSRSPSPEHPNVLLVSLDTTRADHLGAYGNPEARTPAFDRLASEGVLFTRAWTVTPLTTPAHASLLTGLYPGSHGVRSNGRFALPSEAITLAEALGEAGYDCAAFVAGFPVSRIFGMAQGFEPFDDSFGHDRGGRPRNERSADEVNASAVPWLERSLERAGKPFFVWIHYYDPHDPYRPPEPYAGMFPGSPYDGEVAFVDSELARVIELLRERDALDDTVVLVVGDHGEGLEDHGEPTHGMLIYEPMIRIPLVVRAPGLPRGERTDEPASIVDVFPTLLALAGLAVPENVQGRVLMEKTGSAADPLVGEPTDGRLLYAESFFANEEFGWAPLYAVRQEDDKWIAAPTPERFDLGADPRETRNLAGTDPDVDERMEGLFAKAVIGSARQAVGASAEMEPDEEVLERLRSLGYIGGGGAGEASPEAGGVSAGRDPKEAIADYTAYLHATALVDRGAGGQAAPLLERLVENDPRNPMFRLRLGNAFLAMRELKKAEGVLRELIEIHPTFYLAYRQLSTLLEFQKRTSESRDLWIKLRGLGGGFVGLEARLAKAYLLSEQPAEALALCEEFLASHPEDGEMLAHSGSALEALGRGPEAIERYRAALEVDPSRARALRSAALLLSAEGRSDDARALVQDCLRRSSNDPRVQRVAAAVGVTP